MPTGEAAAQAGTKAPPKEDKSGADKGPGSLAGNLTDDPNLTYTSNGKPVCTVRVATSERVKNTDTGKWENGQTVFFTVRAWGQLAENMCEYLRKGDRVVTEGRWREEKWTNDQGEQTRIVLVATDFGPSMMFRGARIIRPVKKDE